MGQQEQEPGTVGPEEESETTAARREVEQGSAGPTQSGAGPGPGGGVTLGAQEEPPEQRSAEEVGSQATEQPDDEEHPQAQTPPN